MAAFSQSSLPSRNFDEFDHVGKHQSGKMQEDAFASTGYVLARELHPSAVQAAERYPKIFINPEKKTMGRKYPFSEHDNRATLKHNIDTYGLGRKKCVGDRQEYNSHISLCHDGGVSAVCPSTRDHSAYQRDPQPRQGAETSGGPNARRFPRSHLQRTHRAATVQDREGYMWFGRHDLERHIPLNVLAAANHSC
ncbi:testis-expressed protein 36 isoform X2 [Electrophorus electricus]|uniref:testis-expressed protein 36 isoform X2 n=1 Tax=Electrophorus electricus TaxID=8005 RepID=UPI0015D0B637|nr:testis-expressed protein 36 isoform X2 [Electrophorus electricus]